MVRFVPLNKNTGHTKAANPKTICFVCSLESPKKRFDNSFGASVMSATMTRPVIITQMIASFRKPSILSGFFAPKFLLMIGCKESLTPKLIITPTHKI